MRELSAKIATLAAAAALSAALAGAQEVGGSQSPVAAPTHPTGQAAGVTAATDSEFLADAVRRDLAAIRGGALAEQRAHDARIRAYGAKLKADHSRTMDEAAALLESAGFEVPTEPRAEAANHYRKLEALSGPDFDAAFVEHMMVAHREAIEAYGAATHANPNEALDAFAQSTLAMLREHLAHAESLQTGPAALTRTDPHLRLGGEQAPERVR